MNFSRAFKYPFNNSAKVISIVLVLTMAFVICIALVVNAADWSPYLDLAYYDSTYTEVAPHEDIGAGFALGVIGLLAIVIFGGFWTSGYSAAAVREVMNGNDTLPSINFGKNVRRGFWLFLSGLAYILVNAIPWLVFFVAMKIAGAMGGFLDTLAFIAVVIAMIAIGALSGWAYFIGMARYALEDDRGPLFDIANNIRIARRNASLGVGLALRFAALTIIYGIVRGIVDGLLGGFAGTDIVVAAAISISIYYVFNLFQHFSTQHLIAQYALAVSGGQDDEVHKFKSDEV